MINNSALEKDLKDMRVVLVADRTYKNAEQMDLAGRDLEMISNEYFDDIQEGLSQICGDVIHYQSPKDLIDNCFKHMGDVILTIYGGSVSRNRMSLVPAICEAYDLTFVGADTYARVICQDKQIAKQFAEKYNIKTARGYCVDRCTTIQKLMELRLPLVIKPNFEGSSIGISDQSKVNSYEDALILVEKLTKQFNGPILVEEFVYGKELCICVMGNGEDIQMFRAMEVYDVQDSNLLLDKIYSAKGKHLSDRSFKHRDVTHKLSKDEISNIKTLFKSLGKMDYMRIDGRLNADGFTLIELTPDAYLGKGSAFSDAALAEGFSYNKLLSELIKIPLGLDKLSNPPLHSKTQRNKALVT